MPHLYSDVFASFVIVCVKDKAMRSSLQQPVTYPVKNVFHLPLRKRHTVYKEEDT